MGQTIDISAEKLDNGGGGGGGETSRVIASLENVNLKDVAANVLTWASGKNAANTAPSSVVLEWISGTFVDNSTAFQLQLNSEQITSSLDAPTLSFWDTTRILIYLTQSPSNTFSRTGNWALPVTVGTLNDFRVNIYILGDTIE